MLSTILAAVDLGCRIIVVKDGLCKLRLTKPTTLCWDYMRSALTYKWSLPKRMNCWKFGEDSKPRERPQSSARRARPLMALDGLTLLLKMLVSGDGSVREQ